MGGSLLAPTGRLLFEWGVGALRETQFFFESTTGELECCLVQDDGTHFELVEPHVDRGEPQFFFAQRHFVFVLSTRRFDLWLDVEESPHSKLGQPLVLLDGSHLLLEMWRSVGAKWALRPRGGERGFLKAVGG